MINEILAGYLFVGSIYATSRYKQNKNLQRADREVVCQSQQKAFNQSGVWLTFEQVLTIMAIKLWFVEMCLFPIFMVSSAIYKYQVMQRTKMINKLAKR